ncbi:hypothetical protein PEC302107_39200 [Pectobacterium araliae]|uniref:Transposase n=1 Tax=Pectobacterium araliae TaxID=3073862 RepID=A0AAN0KHP0_9GAMM|nr:hypothetical protein PEC302110_27560 [Pectobacterium sp. MAFF 302110]GKW22191.1 hypothetical protein PEC302107_39200 [Pectobacterium carotovorum subsp. carotovorum]
MPERDEHWLEDELRRKGWAGETATTRAKANNIISGCACRYGTPDLTLRTRIERLARHTICLSRSVELHEKVIGAFIEKYTFY